MLFCLEKQSQLAENDVDAYATNLNTNTTWNPWICKNIVNICILKRMVVHVVSNTFIELVASMTVGTTANVLNAQTVC